MLSLCPTACASANDGPSTWAPPRRHHRYIGLASLVFGAAASVFKLSRGGRIGLSNVIGEAHVSAKSIANGGMDGARLKELYWQARHDVFDILNSGPHECENWRKSSGQRCRDAQDCGKPWLFLQKGLLLVIPGLPDRPNVSSNSTSSSERIGDGDTAHLGQTDWNAGEARVVTVLGLREGGEGEQANCHAEDVSIVIRLQGPEALAEAAVPLKGMCAWEVEFRPTMAGVYTLDATLISWRGGLEPHPRQCNEVMGAYPDGSVKMHGGVPLGGGPFYGRAEACCTLCTRTEGCVGWSATTEQTIALVDGDRCVLYSSVSGQPVESDSFVGVVRSGTPRREEAMAYIGPSMDISRSWCSNRSGVLLGSGRRFNVHQVQDASSSAGRPSPLANTVDDAAPPPCRSHLLHRGRWVHLDGMKCVYERNMLTSDGWPAYDKKTFGDERSEACFLQPSEAAPELPGSIFESGGYQWEPYECHYDLLSTESRQACMKTANITRFLDFGDSLITTSRAPRVAMWLANSPDRWATRVSLRDVDDGAEASGCVGNVQFYAEDSLGDGLKAHYCGIEAYWQATAGQVSYLVNKFAPDVVLANWALVHHLWHDTFDDFKKFSKLLGRHLDAMMRAGGHKPRFMFWLALPFIVSEREPHCVLERAVKYNEVLRNVLQPRGWIEIDWMSMTRKWSVDIQDGLHHTNPSTRMLAYMLTHHICSNA